MNYIPPGVDWPALVTQCEARGIPVSRIDHHGTTRVIRSTAQLHAEWEDR